MVSQDKSGPADADENADPVEPTAAEPQGRKLVIGLGVAALVCAVVAGYFFVQRDAALDAGRHRVTVAAVDAVGPGMGDADNVAFLDVAETERVVAAARTVMTTLFSYDYTNVDAHADRIRPLMTAEVLGEFEFTATPTLEMIKQAQTTAIATVPANGIGVRSITGDTAVVDVVMEVSGDNGGTPTAPAMVSLRLTLKNMSGQWIAAKIDLI